MDNPINKYKPFEAIDIKDRQWPSKIINEAPVWCSVDLRGWESSFNRTNGRREEKIGCLLFCVN